MRVLFVLALALSIVQPAWAKTVYYCETVAFAEVSKDNEVNEIQPYRFKMAVTSEKVFFSGKDFPTFAFDDVKRGDDGGWYGAQNLFGETITIGEFSPPNLKVLVMRKSLLSF